MVRLGAMRGLVWLLLVIVGLLLVIPDYVAVEPDEVLGYWLNGDGRVTIFVRRNGRITSVVK